MRTLAHTVKHMCMHTLVHTVTMCNRTHRHTVEHKQTHKRYADTCACAHWLTQSSTCACAHWLTQLSTCACTRWFTQSLCAIARTDTQLSTNKQNICRHVCMHTRARRLSGQRSHTQRTLPCSTGSRGGCRGSKAHTLIHTDTHTHWFAS